MLPDGIALIGDIVKSFYPIGNKWFVLPTGSGLINKSGQSEDTQVFQFLFRALSPFNNTKIHYPVNVLQPCITAGRFFQPVAIPFITTICTRVMRSYVAES